MVDLRIQLPSIKLSQHTDKELTGLSLEQLIRMQEGQIVASHQVCLSTQTDTLISLQEELIAVLTNLQELKKEGVKLQSSVAEYDQLAADLKARRRRHSELKARCKELKQAKKKHQATEQGLRDLLEI